MLAPVLLGIRNWLKGIELYWDLGLGTWHGLKLDNINNKTIISNKIELIVGLGSTGQKSTVVHRSGRQKEMQNLNSWSWIFLLTYIGFSRDARDSDNQN